MADENIETTEQVSEEPTEQSAESSAVTENTEPSAEPQEHMIPKSRFDEINKQLKALQAAQSKADKERADAERKQLEEQQRYKELYEKAQQEAAQAAADLKAAQIESLKNTVASELGLPKVLAARLTGETREEIEVDAKSLLESIPKPQAPNVGNNSGSGNAPSRGAMTDQEKREIAAIYGVDPQYIE